MTTEVVKSGKKIARKFMAHYIDTSTTGDGSAYERLGSDLSEFNTDMNANSESKTNILGENTVVIDSYKPTGSVEPYYAVVGSKLFDRLQEIIDNRLVLDDLKTSVVEVHLWEQPTSETKFKAYKEEAFIEVKAYGGDTTGYQIAFDLHYTGNRKAGTFDVSNKTFEATA